MDGCMEVGNRNGSIDYRLGLFIGLPDSPAMFQASASQDQGEGTGLMATTTRRVKVPRPAEFRSDHNERFVHRLRASRSSDQRSQRLVEFLQQNPLRLLTFFVSVPAGSINEVQIVSNFDESYTSLG